MDKDRSDAQGQKAMAAVVARNAAEEPTSEGEVWAWWLYMAAIEPVSVVALQLFLPLLLNAVQIMVGHVSGQPNLRCTGAEDEVCVIFHLGSLEVTGNAYSYINIALAVALQAVIFVCFGALADYGRMRRTLLSIATAFGCLFCVATLGVRGSTAAIVGAALNSLITLSFGASLMFYNSYLPLLAGSHPRTTSFRSEDPLEVAKRREDVANDLSTKSFMIGYGSAVLVLLLSLGFVKLCEQFGEWKVLPEISGHVLQYIIALCGLIWGLGSIYPLIRMKSRPGPDLPKDASLLTFSVKKTVHTAQKHSQLPHLFTYLLCYFLFSDGCNTIGQVAVIFAKSVLKAKNEVLITCTILAPCSGVAGNFFFFYLQRKLRMSSKNMLLVILGGIVALTAYAGCGIFTAAFGLHHLWELYLMSSLYGFLMGAMQSFSRVIYGEMIPPGEEAEFFSLYAITDKGGSWIGPVIQALIDISGFDRRYGLLCLGLMILLPMPVLVWRIDTDKGKMEASMFAQRARTARHQLDKS